MYTFSEGRWLILIVHRKLAYDDMMMIQSVSEEVGHGHMIKTHSLIMYCTSIVWVTSET